MKQPILLTMLGQGVVSQSDISSVSAFESIITQGINLVIIFGAILMFYSLIMGALNWIQSNGEKDKLEKARKQMTNAMIGIVILLSIWSIFFLITSDILGIFQRDASGGIVFNFPFLFGK